ncbi:EAL domain-containing protein [Symbioplanes lichenis]|uniref:EAL domain-containing protein n=1 Tax=Symbioplanes lichenis TaxID=1629072 RepID=UPI0034DACECD
MRTLRDQGVRFAIHDVGSGHLELNTLSRLPVSFIGFRAGADAPPIAPAVIRLGQSFGLATVAEGVDTAEQARKLVELGCDYAHGPFFSAPLTPAATAGLLRRAPLLS